MPPIVANTSESPTYQNGSGYSVLEAGKRLQKYFKKVNDLEANPILNTYERLLDAGSREVFADISTESLDVRAFLDFNIEAPLIELLGTKDGGLKLDIQSPCLVITCSKPNKEVHRVDLSTEEGLYSILFFTNMNDITGLFRSWRRNKTYQKIGNIYRGFNPNREERNKLRELFKPDRTKDITENSETARGYYDEVVKCLTDMKLLEIAS